MKRKKTSRFNSFIMVMLIISFLFGFCGVGTLFGDKNEVLQTEQVSTLINNPANVIPEKEPVIDSGNYTVKMWDEKLEEMFDNGQDFDFEGSGSDADPYKISTAEELALVSYLSNHNGSYPYTTIYGQKENPETFKAIVTEATPTTEAVYEDLIELDYLEGNGINFIRSGNTECSRVSGKIELLENASGAFFGYGANTNFKIGVDANNVWIQGKTQTSFSHSSLINKKVDMDINFNNKTYVFGDQNGELGDFDFKASVNCYIFGYDFYGESRARDICKNVRIYSFQMYDYSDDLVRNFVPCYRVSDRTRGFYDKETKKFITAAENGDGDFNTIKNGAIQGKIIELANDVYLNDGILGLAEKTDENGEIAYLPSYSDGGDGFLYQWKPITKNGVSYNFKTYSILGNRYNVYGMYVNENTDKAGLFGHAGYWGGISIADDLHLKNSLVYSTANNVGGFIGSTNMGVTIKNSSYEGYVVGNSASGFSGGNATYTNCINYSKIIAKAGATGFGGGSSTNCINYGSIEGSSCYGISTTATDCINYGNINAKTASGYGICSGVATNCINYGDVTSKSKSYGITQGQATDSINYGNITSLSGACFGLTNSNATNCKNYGIVTGKVESIAVGYNVTNCINYGKVIAGHSGFGVGSGSASNCKNYGDIVSEGTAYGITGASATNCVNYGNLTSKGTACGISSAKTMNCINYGSVISKSHAMGIGCGNSIINCTNYGAINGSYAGGIASSLSANTEVSKSCNYGDVESPTANAGGLIGFVSKGTIKIIRCSNAGMVISKTEAGGLVGLITGGSASIDSCTNEGKIIGTTATGFIGKKTSLCTMKNCLNTGDIESSTYEETTLSSTFGVTYVSQLTNCITSSKINGEKVNACAYVKDGYFSEQYRTGKIISSNASHTAQFQGVIDADYIKENNFTDFTPSPEDSNKLYTKLEYIQSDGNQYIDTGYVPNQDTKVEVDFLQANSSSNHAIFCAREDLNRNTFSLFKLGAEARFDYGNSQNSVKRSIAGERYKIIADCNNLYIDGEPVAKVNKTAFSTTYTMWIGASYKGAYTTVDNYASMKLYSFKIWDQGILVRDFIPVKRNSDGAVGLYETKEGRFYTDAKGGNFTAGQKADKVPIEYQKVEYLQSSGQQCIDTGLFPNSTMKIEIDTQSTSDFSVFGGLGYNGVPMFNLTGNGTRSFRWGKETWNGSGISCQTRHLISFGHQILVDGVLKREFTYYDWTSTCKLVLFARNGNTNGGISIDDSGGLTTIYSCKIYDKGVLVRDYVPVRRVSDNVAGLYDRIEWKFYENAGSEAFAIGNDV